MYYYYVYITMIVYFLTDVMKWLRGKWNQLLKLVIPVWSSVGQDFCVPSMHNHEFKFGYQHFLLCQKSFLKVSSKWLLKNKSDNGKLLLGKTYSGERFRAILALLFKQSWKKKKMMIVNTIYHLFKNKPWCLKHLANEKEEHIFRVVQIQSICRWQNKCNWRIETFFFFFLRKVENIWGKGETSGYQQFFSHYVY